MLSTHRLAKMKLTKEKLAKMIDHTKLKPYETQESIKKLCQEAIDYGFAAVCVNSCWAKLCAELLEGSQVKTACVVGFPLGTMSTEAKAYEAEYVVKNGAQEVDMVINVGALKEKKLDFVKADIQAVVEVAKAKDSLVKVILETGYLTDDEKISACKLAKASGASFVKTSTGFGPFGALPYEIRLMRKTVGPGFGVKAAGGITDFRSALRCIEAGANRLGTSAGITIVESLDWAKYSSSWFIEEIPCKICPSRFASLAKQPEKVYLYYKSKCIDCPNREYNIFND